MVERYLLRKYLMKSLQEYNEIKSRKHQTALNTAEASEMKFGKNPSNEESDKPKLSSKISLSDYPNTEP